MILTVIDTETTGLDLVNHEVIQVGIVQARVDPTRIIRTFKWEANIKPSHIELASPIALKVNGYTSAKWKDAYDAKEVLPIIKNCIETSNMLVGQNLIFDVKFINKLFDDNKVSRPIYPNYYDTKLMAEQLKKQGILKRSSLDYLCEHYKIKQIGRSHTALADADRTLEIYKILTKITKSTQLSVENPYDPYNGK